MLPSSFRRAFSSPALGGQTQLQASSSLTTWAGLALAALSIAYAPTHTFDDLDCQSYCQRYASAGGFLEEDE